MHTGSRQRVAAVHVLAILLAAIAWADLAMSRAWAQTQVRERSQRFVRFGPEDGLPSEISALAVDRAGVLWAATGNGLMRYDGTELKILRRARGVRGSLPGNRLAHLAIDRDDRIWVASHVALSVMDPHRRAFVHIRFEGDAARCDDDIGALAASPDGALWLSGQGSVLCRIERDGTISRIAHADGERIHGIPTVLLALAADDLLIGTTAGVYRHRHGRLQALAPSQLGEAVVFHVKRDDDGTAWVGTDAGVFRISRQGEVSRGPWRLPERATNAVVSPRGDGGYWIGTALGLFTAQSTGHAAVQVRPPPHEDGLSSGVFDQVRDHEGGWWFASYMQGLSYLPPGHGRFETIEAIDGETLSRIDPVAIAAGAGDAVWLAGARTLYAVPGEGRPPRLRVGATTLGLRWLNAVTVCPDGRLWVAGFDKDGIDSVVQVDPRSGRRLREHRARVESVASPQRLFCSRDGDLWVSLYGGGIRVLDRDARVVRELSAADTVGERPHDYIVFQAGPGGLPWFHDAHALRRWHAGRFEPVVPMADSDGEPIHAVAFVAPDTWWIARYGILERHVWRDGRLLRQAVFDQDDGLPGIDVGSLLVVGDQVWMATTRGLLQYDARQRRARLHGMRDGLPGLDFSQAAMQRDARGRVLAMAKEGLVWFDPAQPLPTPKASALAIDVVELRRDEDRVAFDVPAASASAAMSHVTMAPGDRDLRIVARVMSFADPALHRYRFRLHGFDPDWVLQDARGERVFSSLPPGTYRLEVQGANADGAWSPSRHIDVVVLAPWWRRGWAFALYALALAGVVAWGVRYDRRRARRRHAYQLAKQRQMMAEDASLAKSRFLANLGHEVRTPMTGVLGMSELLLGTSLDTRQRGHVHAIHRAGEHLMRLVNDALDLARAEAGRLELAPVDFDLHALLDESVALMRPLAERKALRFTVERDAGVASGWSGDATRIRQILLNLLGNAIKFTERGEVVLRLASLSPRGVRIEVIDTGPGLDIEQQRRLFRRFEQAEGARTASRYGGSGLGLAICQELAVAMGGGVELRSAPGEGACFIVRLPLEPAALPEAAPAARDGIALPACAVLLVEDDAIVAEALAGLLQAQGHRVVHAGHALAALAAIATDAFDVALVDLDLPGMDGLALARHLRMQGFVRPMLAITARADSDAEPQALDAGFDGFLRKPLTGEMLAEALATHQPLLA
jgi:signal transduction histidine kinase/ligand-binding sensor domain-containing protein/CheY-like chemotaxis protein